MWGGELMEQFPIVEIKPKNGRYDKNGNLLYWKNADGFEFWWKYDKNGDCYYQKNYSGYERYFSTVRDATGTYPVFYTPKEWRG